eukprot:8586272-Heterocapsa_arctica.AAC.1
MISDDSVIPPLAARLSIVETALAALRVSHDIQARQVVEAADSAATAIAPAERSTRVGPSGRGLSRLAIHRPQPPSGFLGDVLWLALRSKPGLQYHRVGFGVSPRDSVLPP